MSTKTPAPSDIEGCKTHSHIDSYTLQSGVPKVDACESLISCDQKSGNERPSAVLAVDANDFQHSTLVNCESEHQLPQDGGCASAELVDVSNFGPHHFELLRLVGEGAFGKVLLVRNRFDQQLHAMKIISKRVIKKKNSVAETKMERDILTKLKHPFIVSLDFAFQTEQKLYLVMQFLSGGELFYHLRKRGIILEGEMRVYVAELVLALEFLHSKQIVHRDLKPENILLKSDGHICVTDFGLAKDMSELGLARTLCGTCEYMAPEMISRSGYGFGVDWWSLGVLSFEMLTSKLPFFAKNEKDLCKKILTERLVCPSFLTPASVGLLKGLLEKDMTKRLGSSRSTMFSQGGVQALKQHVFFEGVDWLEVFRGTTKVPINPQQVEYKGRNCGNKDKVISEVDKAVTHFCKEFTDKPMSMSIVEDTLTEFAENTQQSDESDLDQDGFEGFQYCPPLKVPAEEFRAAEAAVAETMSRLQKRREQKQRKEVVQATKNELLLQERKREEQNNRLALLRQRVRDSEAIDIAEKLDKIQRRLRTLRKKLKEIVSLKSVDSGLTSEQQEKVSKFDVVEIEIREAVAEELKYVELQSSLQSDAEEVRQLETILGIPKSNEKDQILRPRDHQRVADEPVTASPDKCNSLVEGTNTSNLLSKDHTTTAESSVVASPEAEGSWAQVTSRRKKK